MQSVDETSAHNAENDPNSLRLSDLRVFALLRRFHFNIPLDCDRNDEPHLRADDRLEE